MRKFLFTVLAGIFGAIIFASPALAATSASFTPVNVNVTEGQDFTLRIAINPHGTKNYTAKMEVHFSADLIEVKSFAFANTWMAISQSGYNLTDNTNGVLIKSAGNPGGVSSSVTFGTVSFSAKKSGKGTITLNGNSFVLDANNQNTLNAFPQSAVTISALPAVTQPLSASSAEVTAETVTSASIANSAATTATAETSAEPEGEQETPISIEEEPANAQSSLLANVLDFTQLGTDNANVGILVTVTILIVAGYVCYAVIRRIKHN